jgi:hypothetical protein
MGAIVEYGYGSGTGMDTFTLVLIMYMGLGLHHENIVGAIIYYGDTS